MTGLLPLLGALVPLVYLLAWVDYAVLFLRDTRFARRTATPLLVGALALHLVQLVARSAATRRCPMGNLPEVLSVLVFAVVAIYLYLETRQKNRYSGVFLLGLVLPVILISLRLPVPTRPPSPLLKSPLFGLHTLLAMAGYAALIVSTVYGVMYLLLHRALKRQSFGLLFVRLPSLEGLSDMTVGAAGIGFAALTLTIGVGIFWGLHAVRTEQIRPEGSFWTDPKIIFTVLVWALYGLGVVARTMFRWSRRAVVLLFLAGFVMAVLAVILLNTWLVTFHRFSA